MVLGSNNMTVGVLVLRVLIGSGKGGQGELKFERISTLALDFLYLMTRRMIFVFSFRLYFAVHIATLNKKVVCRGIPLQIRLVIHFLGCNVPELRKVNIV